MGIVNAFTGMAAQGASGGLAGISAGIAEALITTAFGLMVAIPAVWAYNYFTTKIENLTVEMTYTSKELIDYLIKSVGSEFGRSIFTKEFQAQKAVTGSGQIQAERAPCPEEVGPCQAVADRTDPVKSEPNVMPMIDVMLVLLIIFMIVTPLIAAGFKATMPKGKNLDPRPGGRQRGGARHRRGRPVLPQRPAASRGDARGPAARHLRGPNRGQDPVLQGGQPAEVRQDPGSGGDRPPVRRAGDGRHHGAERRSRGCSAPTKDKKEEK